MATEEAPSGLMISPQDILDIIRRRWWVFLLPAILVFGLAVLLIMSLPASYLSSGTILVEGQQIPDSLVKTTVDGDAKERIGVVRRLVMTRENLLNIIEQYDLFPGVRDRVTEAEKLALLRAGITIETLQPPGSKRSTSVAFRVSYESDSPHTAFAVTDELVNLFLRENFRTRTQRATETTDFLTGEASNLKDELDGIEARIATYKQQHSNALPEHLKLHMDMLERTQTQLQDTKIDIKSTQDELRFLEVERAAVAAGMGGGELVLTPAQELARAETELARLQGLYSDRHPDVRKQLALVNSLRVTVAESNRKDASGSAELEQLEASDGSLDLARVDAQIKSVTERVDTLRDREQELEAKQRELEGIVMLTPEVERGLAIMNRDYENTEKKFKEITAKAMEARMAQALEEGEQAERFTIIDPPVLPDYPFKPNRKKLLLLAFVAAAVVGAGVVFVLEMLDRKIRGASGVQRALGRAPLVVVPYVTVVADDAGHDRYQRLSLGASLALALLLFLAIHFFVMPLDTVFGQLPGSGE